MTSTRLAALGFMLTTALVGCELPPDAAVEQEEASTSLSVPAPRKLFWDSQNECNAKPMVNWFDASYASNPLCVPPNARGTCDAEELSAIERRIANGYVKCPGCDEGETGCQPRASLGEMSGVALKGGNCCLVATKTGISQSFTEWCTTCVGTDCTNQDADTGVCIDKRELNAPPR